MPSNYARGRITECRSEGRRVDGAAGAGRRLGVGGMRLGEVRVLSAEGGAGKPAFLPSACGGRGKPAATRQVGHGGIPRRAGRGAAGKTFGGRAGGSARGTAWAVCGGRGVWGQDSMASLSKVRALCISAVLMLEKYKSSLLSFSLLSFSI